MSYLIVRCVTTIDLLQVFGNHLLTCPVRLMRRLRSGVVTVSVQRAITALTALTTLYPALPAPTPCSWVCPSPRIVSLVYRAGIVMQNTTRSETRPLPVPLGKCALSLDQQQSTLVIFLLLSVLFYTYICTGYTTL